MFSMMQMAECARRQPRLYTFKKRSLIALIRVEPHVLTIPSKARCFGRHVETGTIKTGQKIFLWYGPQMAKHINHRGILPQIPNELCVTNRPLLQQHRVLRIPETLWERYRSNNSWRMPLHDAAHIIHITLFKLGSSRRIGRSKSDVMNSR